MTASRDPVRSGARIALLLASGLALGFGWQLMQPEQQRKTSDSSWFSNTIDAVRKVVVREATGHASALPPMALRSTMVDPDEPTRSTAVLDFGKGRIYTLRTGDMVPGVGQLLEVTNEGVHLQVNGNRMLFTFSDSTLGSADTPLQLHAMAQGAVIQEGAPGATARGEMAPGPKFIVPSDAPRLSDAPRNEPELNATPKPGQSIDTTVWD